MSCALNQTAHKYASQSATLCTIMAAGSIQRVRKPERRRYGTRMSAGEMTERSRSRVLREMQNDASRLIDTAATPEAAGFVFVGHNGSIQFQRPLRRSVLRAVLERTDGEVAVARVFRGPSSERRQMDAVQLSSSGVEEPGQLFNVIIAEISRPDGAREIRISYVPLGNPEERRNIRVISAADATFFAGL